jgi:SAM-dependent methyltransferase
MPKDYDIFISYSGQNAEFVTKLSDSLKKRGVKAWEYARDIQVGASIAAEVNDALGRCRTFGVVLSKAALDSKWVINFELGAAMDLLAANQITAIIPIRIESVELPPLLRSWRSIDFSDPSRFGEGLDALVRSIAESHPGPLPGPRVGPKSELHELIGRAQKSLVVSALTLDKFTTDGKVMGALHGQLMKREPPEITFLLLNPYCAYARAHERFHPIESRSPLAEQIKGTISVFQRLLEDARDLPHAGRKLSVYLTSYMPRFRAVIVDDSACHVSFYMYAVDVITTPEVLFRSGRDAAQFESVSRSLEDLRSSPHCFPLILDGQFDESWHRSEAGYYLEQCLADLCSKKGCDIAAGVLFDRRPGNASGNWAGTFSASMGLNTGLRVGKIGTLDDAIARSFERVKSSYPGYLSENDRKRTTQDARHLLQTSHHGQQSFWSGLSMEDHEDFLDRLLLARTTGHPAPLQPLVTGSSAETRSLELVRWLEQKTKQGLDRKSKDDRKQPEKIERRRWLRWSILTESLTAEQLERGDISVMGMDLWHAVEDGPVLEAENFFFHIIDTNTDRTLRFACFPSTRIATVFTLRLYEELLRDKRTLEVTFVPRSTRIADYSSTHDVTRLLKEFPSLERRASVSKQGSQYRALTWKQLHRDLQDVTEAALLLDVRGSNSFRSLQGAPKICFFGFMALDTLDRALVGVHQVQPVLIHQNPGDRSFHVNRYLAPEAPLESAIARRVCDRPLKWAGGDVATIASWKESRRFPWDTTNEFYASEQIEFFRRFGQQLEPYVEKYLDSFKLCRRVLVLGCGAGKEAYYLHRNRSNPDFQIIALDLITEPILYARETYPEIREQFLIGDLYSLPDLLDGEFDGIVANAALVHLLEIEDLRDRVMPSIWNRLHPGGLAFIRLLYKPDVPGGTEYSATDEFPNKPRKFTYYSEEELCQIAESAGFKVLRRSTESFRKAEIKVWWPCVLLQKPEGSQ